MTKVLGSLPEIGQIRYLVVRDLPTFEISKIDKFEAYTLAVSHVHILYWAAWAPEVEVSTLAAELTILSTIAARTPVTLDVLDHDAVLAEQSLQAVGLRDQASPTSGEAAVTRLKAFTASFNAYEDVRRAIKYVRDKTRDADEIAPPLFAGRAVGWRKGTEDQTAVTGQGTAAPTGKAATALVAAAGAGLPITQLFES